MRKLSRLHWGSADKSRLAMLIWCLTNGGYIEGLSVWIRDMV